MNILSTAVGAIEQVEVGEIEWPKMTTRPRLVLNAGSTSVITVAVIAGGIFSYFLHDVRQGHSP